MFVVVIFHLFTFLFGPCGVMVKAMDCGIVGREFELQSRYSVHFRANNNTNDICCRGDLIQLIILLVIKV